jgi:hypothetical protein
VDGEASSQREHEGLGFLAPNRYLLHDGDGKFCSWFREVIGAGQVRTVQLPAGQAQFECLCGTLGTIGET